MIRKKKKSEKTYRKRLIEDLDEIAGKIVRTLGRGQCIAHDFHKNDFQCGNGIQCNHVFQRRHYQIRWDLDNLFPACGSFNVWSKFNEGEMHAWYLRKFPEKYKRLEKLTGEYKPSITEMEVELKYLRSIAARYGIK